ncbi:GNAT family N-acetyltransferase [Psychroserpens ponticola]|uniref:GNAT family N-acetyltransferase n=1 Tax=Psychroserpens ponticola TaxID=2932268 RepID=A0ABY7RYF5_9FLAO|nr:GNAT family N-acetyltransferase [Psychroserpens ponticola]WCO01787.1 GNAT family N-acetyltransferase [Psychroserpens ponticola]
MKNKQLLNNHICFLQQNRGSKRDENKNIRISSEVDNWDITFLINEYQPTINSKMIYLPEWSSNSNQIIKSDKAEKIADLTYMFANPNVLKEWKTNNSIVTKKVINNSDLELFSIVQSRGFCETNALYNEWFPFFRKKNFEGALFKNQHFFIAYIADKAVGTCLIIDSNDTYGIYSVTTLPEYRKKGIATNVMKSALVNCINIKVQNLTLQTIKDSSAEKLYIHLGFKKEFNCQVLKRKNSLQQRV